MWKPINRTRVQVGENRYRVYDKRGPLFYKKPDGTYDDIDHTFNDTTSTIGDISLMDKGILSVGKRKGNNPHKVVGIRPDTNQHLGTQQLEFSLINVELDGESQEFNVEDDLEIRLRASKVFQLVKINKDFNNFKIEFDIHSKGLELQNNKYSEETTIRDYNFNLTNLGQIEVGNTDLTRDNFFKEQASDVPYFDFYVSQIINEYITTGEYSLEEEFGDDDLSEYVLDGDFYTHGSSIYYKDSIILAIKLHDIPNFEEVIVNEFCSMYGLETIHEDNKNGKYFTKDGKKIGSYFTVDENTFYVLINTKPIPDKIKALFKRKTFEDTSFLDLTLESFCEDINNSKFNIDLKLNVDSDYYEPFDNKFEFKVSNESMYINKPIIYDKDYNGMPLETTHTLKQNEDGSYRYTKYFDINGYFSKSNDIAYIDATLQMNQSEDARLYKSYTNSDLVGTAKTNTNLQDARDAATGTGFSDFDNQTDEDKPFTFCGDIGNQTTTSSGQFGSSVSRYWRPILSNFYFDTSGISTTVTDASFKVLAAYGAYDSVSQSIPEDISVILVKANFNKGQTSAYWWNDIVGHTSGWDSNDVTEYSAETVIDGYEDSTSTPGIYGAGSSSDYVVETVTLNSDAESDMENNDSFDFQLQEYDQYYSNSLNVSYAAGGSNAFEYRVMFGHQVDHQTTSYRPYLEYTAEAGDAVTYDANFFGANF